MIKTHPTEGWEFVTLDKVFVPCYDKWEPDGSLNELVNYIGLENIEPHTGKLIEFKPTISSGIKSTKNVFSSNDVLYGKLRPYLNKVLMPDFDGICSTDIIVLKPKSNILRGYLWYFLRSDHVLSRIAKLTYGTKMPRTRIQDLERIQIPLPPKDVQLKMVRKLDYLLTRLDEMKNKIFEVQYKKRNLIANNLTSFKSKIKQSNNLKSQILQDCLKKAFSGMYTLNFRDNYIMYENELNKFYNQIKTLNDKINLNTTSHLKETNLPIIPNGWYWTDIGSISTFVGSGITPLGGKSVYVNTGIPFIRSQNVHIGSLIQEDLVFITPELHSKLSRTHIQPRDILLNITGASIGRSVVIGNDFGPGNVNQHVCIIRTHDWMNPEFISWWLNSSPIQKIIDKINRGETREALNYAHIRLLPIPITTTVEQNEIVRILREHLKSMLLIYHKIGQIESSYDRIEQNISDLTKIILKKFMGMTYYNFL